MDTFTKLELVLSLKNEKYLQLVVVNWWGRDSWTLVFNGMHPYKKQFLFKCNF